VLISVAAIAIPCYFLAVPVSMLFLVSGIWTNPNEDSKSQNQYFYKLFPVGMRFIFYLCVLQAASSYWPAVFPHPEI